MTVEVPISNIVVLDRVLYSHYTVVSYRTYSDVPYLSDSFPSKTHDFTHISINSSDWFTAITQLLMKLADSILPLIKTSASLCTDQNTTRQGGQCIERY